MDVIAIVKQIGYIMDMTKHKNPMYSLRLPSELKDYLASEAETNNTSLNAEITARLSETKRQDDLVRDILANKNGVIFSYSDLMQLYSVSLDTIKELNDKLDQTRNDSDAKFEELSRWIRQISTDMESIVDAVDEDMIANGEKPIERNYKLRKVDKD